MIINKDFILDFTYPIGSIYMSVNSTEPSTLFGGTWERIQGRFLLGASSSYTAGSTGGSATVTLTQQQMPTTVPTILNLSGNQWSLGVWEQHTNGGYSAVLPGQHGTGGQNQPHNNMPPYLAVYMWKRIS